MDLSTVSDEELELIASEEESPASSMSDEELEAIANSPSKEASPEEKTQGKIDTEYDSYLQRKIASGENPSANPTMTALGGLVNKAIPNLEETATMAGENVAFGLGRYATRPINAAIRTATEGGKFGENWDAEKARSVDIQTRRPEANIGASALMNIGLGPAFLGAVAKGGSKLIRSVAPKVGLALDKRQALSALKRAQEFGFSEDQIAKSIKQIQMASKGTYDDAAIEFGKRILSLGDEAMGSAKGLQAAGETAKAAGGAKMQSVFDKVDETGAIISPEKIAQEVEAQLGGFYRSPANKAISNQFDDILESIRMRGAQADKTADLLNETVKSTRADEILARVNVETNIAKQMEAVRNEIDQMMDLAATPEQLRAANLFKTRLESKMNNLQELQEIIDARKTGFNVPEISQMRFGQHRQPEMLEPLFDATKARLGAAEQAASYVPDQAKISTQSAQGLKNEISGIGFPKGKAPISPSDRQIMAQQASKIIKKEITKATEQAAGAEGVELLNQGRKQFGIGSQVGQQKGIAKEALREIMPSTGVKVPSNLGIGKMAMALPEWGINKAAQMASDPNVLGTASRAVKSTVPLAEKIVRGLKDPNLATSFSKYAAPLTQAIQRGPAALTAVDYVLGTTDPNYRNLQRQLNGQESPEGR